MVCGFVFVPFSGYLGLAASWQWMDHSDTWTKRLNMLVVFEGNEKSLWRFVTFQETPLQKLVAQTPLQLCFFVDVYLWDASGDCIIAEWPEWRPSGSTVLQSRGFDPSGQAFFGIRFLEACYCGRPSAHSERILGRCRRSRWRPPDSDWHLDQGFLISQFDVPRPSATICDTHKNGYFAW